MITNEKRIHLTLGGTPLEEWIGQYEQSHQHPGFCGWDQQQEIENGYGVSMPWAFRSIYDNRETLYRENHKNKPAAVTHATSEYRAFIADGGETTSWILK